MSAAGDSNGRPTVAHAVQALFRLIVKRAPAVEVVPVSRACGRVTAQDILSNYEIPAFDKAAMDGYALMAEDTQGATESSRVLLKVVGVITAGVDPQAAPRIARGEAIEITTGAPLPPGANAVVMTEECRRISDRVSLASAVERLENVSRKGEDYRKGDVIVKASCVLRPWHLAALAAARISEVPVVRLLRIGVLSTGTELVEVGIVPGPGQIVNSSKPMLSSMIEAMGCQPVDLGIAPDRLESIRDGLEAGLASCDMVLSTGGSSVGEADLVPETIGGLEGHLFIARGLRLRPGGATGIALVAGKPVFVLSGHPVAAFTAFEALVRPTIRHLLGIGEEAVPLVRARLTERITNRKGYRSYVRVKVGSDQGGYWVAPLAAKGAGLVSTLTNAQGLVVMDENTAVREAGEDVEVRLLEGVGPREP